MLANLYRYFYAMTGKNLTFSFILPPRQIKSTVFFDFASLRIKNRRRQIQTFDQNNN